MTREQAEKDPTVHRYTLQILELSKGLDVVDRYYDVLLAAEILKAEMDEALGD